MIDLKKELEDFNILVTDDKFVLAHSQLEHSWKHYKTLDKTVANILKGLINGTTALALYKKNKIEQSKRVWDTFLKYEDLIYTLSQTKQKLFLDSCGLLHLKFKQVVLPLDDAKEADLN